MTIWLTQNCKSSGLFNLEMVPGTHLARFRNATFRGLNIEPDINFIEMPQIWDKYQYFTQATIEKLSPRVNYNFFLWKKQFPIM